MAVRPIQSDFKLVSFQNDQIAVRAADESLFVDVNPSDRQNKVDYFILGKTTTGYRLPSEAVLLPDAPMPLAAKLAGRVAKTIRQQRADENESTQAQEFYVKAKAYAELQVDGFAQAIQRDQTKKKKQKEIYVKEVGGEAVLVFKGANGKEQYAIPFFQKYASDDGKPQFILSQLRIKVGSLTILVDTKEFLQSIDTLLREWAPALAKENQRIAKKKVKKMHEHRVK